MNLSDPLLYLRNTAITWRVKDVMMNNRKMQKLLIKIFLVMLCLGFCACTNEGGKTALMIAAQQNELTKAKLLIKAGVDVNAMDNTGNTALILASENGHSEIVELLLIAGADIHDCRDAALVRAALNDHFRTVQLLLTAGANPDATSTEAYTTLMLIVDKGSIDIIKALITAGANVNAKSNFGDTALSFASQSNRSDRLTIIQLLKDAGAK